MYNNIVNAGVKVSQGAVEKCATQASPEQ